MTHTYKVYGMTCNGCKASVEEKLNTIKGVTNVSVDLASEEATITMQDHINIEILREALPEKYKVSEKTSVLNDTNEKTKLQQLQPLFIIFSFIVAITIAINFNTWNLENAMLDFMGLFFFFFSLFKFFDLKGFANSFSMYDPLAKQIPVYGMFYPFLELIVGFLFLIRFEVSILLIVTIILLGITTIGVTKSLLSKNNIKCACLGTTLNLPMTEATFIENAIMIIMAVVLLLKNYAI
ncbi:heavy-metal-associated domain-containing protein [Patiriisocius hiemis]|uniref:Heavy metal-associated domain-containing protein n=1 Tax=Patiriisocius hiemis TaxID=3075604 RepID=A0ABU2YE10_9FLAO|nr:heavy metal-associated domain-containing protein [Constantimarinum sp. W242]MDT0556242.1 heavy metal-associated domain-containing protein [Constantimarinum sp. W242]